jgi:hypothetical protein
MVLVTVFERLVMVVIGDLQVLTREHRPLVRIVRTSMNYAHYPADGSALRATRLIWQISFFLGTIENAKLDVIWRRLIFRGCIVLTGGTMYAGMLWVVLMSRWHRVKHICIQAGLSTVMGSFRVPGDWGV